MTPSGHNGGPFPSELLRQVEDGSYGETCDWGFCSRQTEAFAWSNSDAAEEWLPICAPCARGESPEANDEPYPVDRVLWLDELAEALNA